MSSYEDLMMDEVQYTRILLVEAERRAKEQATLCRSRLDKLYEAEQEVAKRSDAIVNPRILRKWREETGL